MKNLKDYFKLYIVGLVSQPFSVQKPESIPPNLRKLSKPCFKNKLRHYFLQILNQEEDYYLTYKKLYRQVYRVYIIGLRYRHDCDQFTCKYGIYVILKLYLYNV